MRTPHVGQGRNTCPDLPSTYEFEYFENIGAGQLVQLDGSLYTAKTTISSDCIAELAAGGWRPDSAAVYTLDAAGCIHACHLDGTTAEANAPGSCEAANHIEFEDFPNLVSSSYLVGISWNDETKTCTLGGVKLRYAYLSQRGYYPDGELQLLQFWQ